MPDLEAREKLSTLADAWEELARAAEAKSKPKIG
jgi:hypothetical protein